MRILLTCILLLNGIFLFGQEAFIGVQVGGLLGRTKLGTFKEFSQRYNKDYESILSKKMGKMTFSSGYEIALDYSYYNDDEIGFVMQLNNEQKFAKTSATFTDPALGTRVYQVRYVTNTYFFGMNRTMDNICVFTGPYLGVSHTFLSAYKKYENGELSYGNESGSNTVYKTRNFTFGLKMGVEYYVHTNLRLYTSMLLGATIDVTSDLPINLPSMLYPLTFVNSHFTFQAGTKIGLTW